MKKLQITCLQSRLRQTRTRAARRCQQHIEEQNQYKKEEDHIAYSAHMRFKAKRM